MATKLYADKLVEARRKDAEENGTYFQDILTKNREFKINLLAKCYQTILNEERDDSLDSIEELFA